MENIIELTFIEELSIDDNKFLLDEKFIVSKPKNIVGGLDTFELIGILSISSLSIIKKIVLEKIKSKQLKSFKKNGKSISFEGYSDDEIIKIIDKLDP